jgi:hypothetical protein
MKSFIDSGYDPTNLGLSADSFLIIGTFTGEFGYYYNSIGSETYSLYIPPNSSTSFDGISVNKRKYTNFYYESANNIANESFRERIMQQLYNYSSKRPVDSEASKTLWSKLAKERNDSSSRMQIHDNARNEYLVGRQIYCESIDDTVPCFSSNIFDVNNSSGQEYTVLKIKNDRYLYEEVDGINPRNILRLQKQ